MRVRVFVGILKVGKSLAVGLISHCGTFGDNSYARGTNICLLSEQRLYCAKFGNPQPYKTILHWFFSL